MMIRQPKSLARLLQALLALAVLFAPITASAMEMPDKRAAGVEHGEAAAASHCSGEPDSSPKPDKERGMPCCAAMCVGTATITMAPAPTAGSILVRAIPQSVAPTFILGSPGELATPPPRLA